MKTQKHMKLLVLIIIVLLTSFSNACFSQQYNLDNAKSELKVYGTSNLHDWDVDAEKQKGTIIIDNVNDLIIKNLKIYAVSESLKSGKNGMDKNTFKALKTDEFKTIIFQMTSTKTISKLADKKYKIEALGDLTIAGVTKNIALNFNMDFVNNDIQLDGEKIIKMTDYNIEPPTALFGTITTGDELTIKFNTKFNIHNN